MAIAHLERASVKGDNNLAAEIVKSITAQEIPAAIRYLLLAIVFNPSLRYILAQEI